MTRYLLDANVFIQAKNLHYGFDFCPAFWDWIDRARVTGAVAGIERVGTEIEAGDDELADWARERSELFLPPDPSIIPSLGEVSTWANGSNYEPVAINTFLQTADYYLVAHGRAHDQVVVTYEVASPSPRRIKIPNADAQQKTDSMIWRSGAGACCSRGAGAGTGTTPPGAS